MSIEAGARAGHDRPRRDHLRLPRGPRRTRPRARTGTPPSRTGRRCAPTTTPCSTPRSSSTPPTLTPFVTWGTNPGQGAPLRRPSPTRRRTTTPRERAAAEKALEYMGLDGRARRCATSRSTPSSSARAPTAASRTCAPPPTIIEGRKVADGVRMLVVPGSARVAPAGRGRGPGRGLQGGRRRVAARGLLDVPGHEPRPAGARGALRVHLQPQLRGPAGQGRPHPPGLAAGRRRHRRRWATSPRPADLSDAARRPLESERHGSIHHAHRPGRPAAPQQRRHRPDHPGRTTSSGSPATGFEDGLFEAWRKDPDFVLNQPERAGRHGPGRRPRLRHRLLPRARRLGAAELRLQGRDLLPLRRHLPRQLAEERPAHGGPGRRRSSSALWELTETDPQAEITVDLRGPRGARRGRSPPPSSSTTTPAGGC